MLTKKEEIVFGKESKISILGLLKNYYDDEIFSALIREYYNTDIDISIAAIASSGVIGNEVVIPHLYEIIEKGKPAQRIAAIKTLAGIKAPSSIQRLIEYYGFFHDEAIRNEIMKSLNTIGPTHKNVGELNRTIFLSPDSNESLKVTVTKALVESEEFELLKRQLPVVPQKVIKAAFFALLSSESEEASICIRFFKDKTELFSSSTLGYFLAAYLIRSKYPQQSYIIDKLRTAEHRTLVAFLIAIKKCGGKISQPINVFRTLLIIPYINAFTETATGTILERIIAEGEAHSQSSSQYQLNEMAMMTKTHIDSIFSKIKHGYISIKNIGDKENLLMVLFTKLLEGLGNIKIVNTVKFYFRDLDFEKQDPVRIIKKIRTQLGDKDKDVLSNFKACLPVFHIRDKKERLKLLNYLKDINLHRPFLQRRLNRLIRVTGHLLLKTMVKKLSEILEFARDEKISYLEETTVVTLCQLFHKATVEQASAFLSSPDQAIPSFNGYLRGAGFMKPEYTIHSLLRLAAQPLLSRKAQLLLLRSLEKLDVKHIKGIVTQFLKLLLLPHLSDEFKMRIGNLVVSSSDASIFQILLNLTYQKGEVIRCVAVRALKVCALKHDNIPMDLLINRFYLLLEDDIGESREEVILALLAIGDDYAIQIFKDYISFNAEEAVARILNKLENPISHDILLLLLSLLRSKGHIIHRALRNVLSRLVATSHGEEIRNALLEYLNPVARQDSSLADDEKMKAIKSKKLINHAKDEFKFKRENAQVLTVLFIDMVGYTEKSSVADNISLMQLIQSFEEIVLPVIKAYKGCLVKKMGDGILAVFKHPLNASFAALTIQEKIRTGNQYKVDREKFEVRIGLNTGLVIRKDNDVFGDVVNIASRMETSANPGDILLTHATYEEIKDYVECTRLGNLHVKGKKETITAYAADSVRPDLKSIIQSGKERISSGNGKEGKNPLTILKESIFSPDFSLPESLTSHKELFSLLSRVFFDIARFSEEYTRDYHDEYAIKRYIQKKWDDLIERFDVPKT
ncbi:MAG: hypothetical protein JW881_00645 [Spirochaetales bacterium]|nr:hypothetical protein [Spirochaetales bacterium]